jgi:hypothetical protein
MLSKQLGQRGKLVLAFASAGIIFSVLVTLSTNFIAGVLNINFASTVGGIVTALIGGDPMAILMIILTTLVFGVFIWIFGFVGAKVKAKIVGGTVKLTKRPHLIGFFLIGALGVAVFGIVDEAIAPLGASSDILELVDDVQSLQILGAIIKVVAFAVIGSVAITLGTKFTTVEGWMPETLKKI